MVKNIVPKLGETRERHFKSFAYANAFTMRFAVPLLAVQSG